MSRLSMKLAVYILLFAVSAGAQDLTPKKSEASLELQVALEQEHSLQLEFALIQQRMEPELQPLRQKFMEQQKLVEKDVLAVKKENGWGADVILDTTVGSPTFGKFIHKPEDKKTGPAPGWKVQK